MSIELHNILLGVQVAVCAVLIVSVLLQNRAEGLGKMFGGGGEVFRTKRGLEKFLYYFTMVLIAIIAALSLILVKYSA